MPDPKSIVCDGKTAFASRAEASNSMRCHKGKRGKGAGVVYKCDYCKKHHITSVLQHHLSARK